MTRSPIPSPVHALIVSGALFFPCLAPTGAQAQDAFHRSHESGVMVYRSASSSLSDAVAIQLERERLAIERQRARTEARYLSRLAKTQELSAEAQARRLRSLERRDNAVVRGVASDRYVPRFDRSNNLGLILDTREAPRRRRRH